MVAYGKICRKQTHLDQMRQARKVLTCEGLSRSGVARGFDTQRAFQKWCYERSARTMCIQNERFTVVGQTRILVVERGCELF
jgi:hypothetical protein